MLAGMLLLAASIATVETMYWHQMRHLAYLALIEAGRAQAWASAADALSRAPSQGESGARR